MTLTHSSQQERVEASAIEVNQAAWVEDAKQKQYHPGLIANWDETMNCLSPQGQISVVTRRNKKPLKVVVKRQGEHVTLGVYIFADGTYTKPQLIVSSKGLPPVEPSLIKHFIWRGQAKGWVTNEIMLESIKKVFIPEIVRRREELGLPRDAPAVLHMDGHRSHNTAELKQVLADNHITLRLFVPHTSHIQQLLDLVIFGKFKKLLKKSLQESNQMYGMPVTDSHPSHRGSC